MDMESSIINVPDKSTKMEVRAKRNDWESGTKRLVTVVVDFSTDNGITWINHFLGFSTIGEDTYLDLVKLNYSDAGRFLPEGTNRKLKVKMDIAKDIILNTKIEIGFD